jgi:hypothetical protein
VADKIDKDLTPCLLHAKFAIANFIALVFLDTLLILCCDFSLVLKVFSEHFPLCLFFPSRVLVLALGEHRL